MALSPGELLQSTGLQLPRRRRRRERVAGPLGEPGKEAPAPAPVPAPVPAETNPPQGLAGDVQKGRCKSG